MGRSQPKGAEPEGNMRRTLQGPPEVKRGSQKGREKGSACEG